MPLQTRGKRRYFYQSVRVGNRVEKRYIGSGVVAQLVAEEMACKRQEMNLLREQERAILSQLAKVEQHLKQAHRAIETLASAALIAAGYHRHDRGPWRRRRT